MSSWSGRIPIGRAASELADPSSFRLAATALALTAALAGMACGGDCAGVGAPAVRVTVLDLDTNGPIARDATLSLFFSNASTPIEVVTGQADTDLLAVGIDHTGRFDVLVEKPGYYPWTSTDVEVNAACTVETVSLTAYLRHLPPPP
jgi:hypothetical protein